MKKLLFIGIVALMVQSLGAVTLPSTSYSPYAGASTSGTGQSLLSGGSMITGSYSVLGEGPCTGQADCTTCCTNNTPGFLECVSQCADDACIEQCAASTGYKSCVDDCEGGGSLPLDGGLSILLILSLAGGAVKLLRNKKVNS